MSTLMGSIIIKVQAVHPEIPPPVLASASAIAEKMSQKSISHLQPSSDRFCRIVYASKTRGTG